MPAPPAAFFNVNADDAARVDALATPHPLGCFTEKIKLTGAHKRIAKRVYVHGTVLPRESPFKPFYDRVKSDPAWQSHALACGHHVMLDRTRSGDGTLGRRALARVSDGARKRNDGCCRGILSLTHVKTAGGFPALTIIHNKRRLVASIWKLLELSGQKPCAPKCNAKSLQ